MKIIVVCTANQCRSPMAEAVMKAEAPPHALVESAGTQASNGMPAAAGAVGTLTRRGIRHDLDRHASRSLTPVLGRTADLILVMEQHHRRWVGENIPALYGRTYLLGHWSETEIHDPIGLGEGEFDLALERIMEGAAEWLRRL